MTALNLEDKYTKLYLSENGVRNLNIARKWAMFLAIMGFIYVGLMFISAILLMLGSNLFRMMSIPELKFAPIIISSAIVLMGVLYLIPMVFLYQFSTSAKDAVKKVDTDEFVVSIAKLKAFFRYIGFWIILGIVIYAGFFVARLLMMI